MIEEQSKMINGYITKLEEIKAKVTPNTNTNKEIVTEIEFFINWLKEILNLIDKKLIDWEICFTIENLVKNSGFDYLERTLFSEEGKLQVNRFDKELIYSAYRNHNIYQILKALGFSKQNSVLIGANGSGKTTLANAFMHSFKMDVGTVIPAQKFLAIPTLRTTPNYEATQKKYHELEKRPLRKIGIEEHQGEYKINYWTQFFAADYARIVATLVAERNQKRNLLCDRIQRKEKIKNEETALRCTLDLALEIWNDLISHRILYCDSSNNLMVIDETRPPNYSPQDYPADQMSDGEKVLFYLIGKVLLASGRHIIVDEPEMYLHKSIVNKLWDRLENEKKGSVFIYLTHDLEFAATRSAQKAWISSFTYPDTWKIEVIYENEIPEELLLKLLGSQREILFCEGDENSLDYRIYEVLFPHFTVIRAGSCKRVINYTRAFNHINVANTKAYGIIDSDFRSANELDTYKQDNIYSYKASEIENLFLIEEFLEIYAARFLATDKVQDLKEKIIAKFSAERELQASQFVASKINHIFNDKHVQAGNNIALVKSHYSSFTQQIDIDNWYSNRLEEIDNFVNQGDYNAIIRIYNNKGLRALVEQSFGIKSHSKKALSFLKENTKAQEILRGAFPNELLKD